MNNQVQSQFEKLSKSVNLKVVNTYLQCSVSKHPKAMLELTTLQNKGIKILLSHSLGFNPKTKSYYIDTYVEYIKKNKVFDKSLFSDKIENDLDLKNYITKVQSKVLE